MRALGDLLDKVPEYSEDDRVAAQKLARDILDSTYLGKLLAHARQRLDALTAEPAPANLG